MKTKFKNLIIILLFAFGLACTVDTNAVAAETEENKCGENVYYTYEDGVLEICGSGDMYDWRVIYGDSFPIRPWGDYTEEVTTVIIHDGVSNIGQGSFRMFSQLEKVVIADSVTSIGKYAFEDCDLLTSITIPDSVTWIGDRSFESCGALKSIKLPDSVLTIGTSIFSHCVALESIEMSQNLQELGSGAFTFCTSLKSIEIPGTVSTINRWTFDECAKLETIILNEGLKKVEGAFYRCTSLKTIKFPKSLEELEDYQNMFCYCKNLQSIYFKGDAVNFVEDGEYFYGLNATIYYPEQNETWTPEIMKNYGGNLIWKPYYLEDCGNHVWGEWTTVKPATYSADGLKKRDCEDCATQEEGVIEQYMIESVSFEQDIIEISANDIVKLHVICEPVVPATDEITWSSSNEKVAVVDKEGNVRGRVKGTAVITAQVGDKKAECTVNVTGAWKEDAIGVRYQKEDGSYLVNGWYFIEQEWYYFNKQGYRVEGWLKQGNTWYYLDTETGIMYENEWLNNQYYFNPDGSMVTGWKLIGGDYYYFYSSGSKATNTWIGSYYLKSDGVMATNEWVDSGKSYVNAAGVYQTGWLKHMDNWYYLGTNGILQTGWVKLSGCWYYLDPENAGAMLANGTYNIGKSIYGFAASGKMFTGFQNIAGDRYYFNSDGSARLGWFKYNGGWYYFDKKDGYALTGITTVDGEWYYFYDDARMKYDCWYLDNNDNCWYYYGADGARVYGWQYIDGIWYYFDLSYGYMYEDGVFYIPDEGYSSFKPDGAWGGYVIFG